MARFGKRLDVQRWLFYSGKISSELQDGRKAPSCAFRETYPLRSGLWHSWGIDVAADDRLAAQSIPGCEYFDGPRRAIGRRPMKIRVSALLGQI